MRSELKQPELRRPELRLRARHMITPDGERPGVVVVRDGIIADLIAGDGAPGGSGAAATAADIEIPDSCVLLPGLVDSHVHVNEPGRTGWEGFATATAAAAAGGVTTIADMPLNSIPATVSVAALGAKQAAAGGQLAIDVAFWGGAVPGNCGDLRPLHEAGVVGFKCFLLPSGVPEFPPLSPAQLRTAMTEIASFGGLLVAHAEDPAVISAAPPARGRGYASFLASRPAAAETAAVRELLAATRLTGCRTHIVHLSAAAALPEIARARQEGLPVTVETCPHYLTLAASQVPDGATQFKCCPPIRDQANQEQLWHALSDGVIDCVVSDHSPCPAEAKHLDTGDFGDAWGGIASLQLGLPAIWTGAAARGLPLTDVARWMSRAPAALIGLPDRGEIRLGQRADFCVFAPEEEFTVDPARLRHRHQVSPYAGASLRGVVRQTWLRGEVVGPGSIAGRLVRRTPGPAARRPSHGLQASRSREKGRHG